MSQEIIKQAPEIIPVLTDTANLTVNIILAGITFCAVLIALFQDKIKQIFNKAKLEIELNLDWPNSHKIDLTNNLQKVSDSFYMRIKVSNFSSVPAENVEIMPIKFIKIVDGRKVPLINFLPISLVWSHFQPETNVIRIPPSFFKHCDLFCFIPNLESNQMRLSIRTLAKPNKVSNNELGNIFGPGKYQFELLVTSDNIKPITKKWEIEFNKWFDNEDELRKNIKLIEI
jgi:hypothetical protein